MHLRLTSFASWLLPLSLLPACGSSDETPDSQPFATGGAYANGGFPGQGGTPVGQGGTPVGQGGTPVGQGGIPVGQGGSSAGGGPQASGGFGAVPGTGGVAQGSGGISGSGGSTASGGAQATGGAGNYPPIPAGATEYTFTTGQFTVNPGSEVYKCQDFPNPFKKDIGVVASATDLTPGSHHMFSFVVPNNQATLTGSLRDCPGGGVEFHDFLTTSGTPHSEVHYKDGIGHILTAGSGLRLNVHLINTSADPKVAFVTFKVWYVEPSTLQNKAANIFLNQILLTVPPGTSTSSRTYTLNQDINVIGAGSHMHKQGVHFVAKTNTGVTLYDGTEWAEPPAKGYDPPIALKAGTQITWSCTYNNPGSTTLTFGESALSNEMCIFPGEFYNKTGTQISYQTP